MGQGGMSCGMKTVRLIMVLFNVVFFLIGVALLALGIYVMVDPRFQKVKEFLPINSNPGIERSLSYLEVIAIVLIVLGSVLLIIGFLGCCGAMKQVKLFLTCYAIIVALIIIVQVAFTIYFVVFQSKFKDQFVPTLRNSLQNTYEGPLPLIYEGQSKPSAYSLAWDFIMYNFKCCGVESSGEFFEAKIWNRTNPFAKHLGLPERFLYPLTCCPMRDSDENWNQLPVEQFAQAAKCATSGVDLYDIGCYTKLLNLLDSAKVYAIGIAVAVLLIQLLAFIFTLALCCRQRKESVYYSS